MAGTQWRRAGVVQGTPAQECAAAFAGESGEDTGTAPTLTPPCCLPCPAQGEPLDLFSLEEAPAEYRRVAVEGAFDHARSQFVGPRTRTIAGSAKQAGWAAWAAANLWAHANLWAACKSVTRVPAALPPRSLSQPRPAAAECSMRPRGGWVLARGGVAGGASLPMAGTVFTCCLSCSPCRAENLAPCQQPGAGAPQATRPCPLPSLCPCPQGFLLITPLRQQGGGRAVMVNRGWVPSEWRHDAAARQAGQPQGKVGEACVAPSAQPGSARCRAWACRRRDRSIGRRRSR